MLALFLLAGISASSDFEGGSIGKVEAVSPAHLRCAVAGQSDQDNRNRQANWYYFRLDNLPKGPVTIDLVNLAGEYNYRAPAYSVTKGSRPLYSYDGKTWTHFRDDQVSWEPKEPHLTLVFTPERSRAWIAHTPPYTNRDLAALLESAGKSPLLRRQAVGRTVEGREMPLLTIAAPPAGAAKRKVVWLMFRQHAWESGTSWVGEGAIRFLLSNDPRAAKIREQAEFKIFPMADPDGVARGGVRFNRNGYDLNRNWDLVDPVKMPEIAAQRKAILDWVDGGGRVDFFLALHNTESGEYLEGPPAFRALGEKVLAALKDSTTFHPKSPLRLQPETTTPGKPGRMTVNQGLHHHRKLPAMLMEQMVEFNSRLGRCPTVADRLEFGGGLVRAIVAALDAGN